MIKGNGKETIIEKEKGAGIKVINDNLRNNIIWT